VQICQGISLGTLFEPPLAGIVARYDPDMHPITGPLLSGGPARLAQAHGIKPADGYADACHMCYTVRESLRERFPDELAPDQMYGVTE
jgi:hypothetical protein